MRLNPEGGNPESSPELIKFLPVLAFDGTHMKELMLARSWTLLYPEQLRHYWQKVVGLLLMLTIIL